MPLPHLLFSTQRPQNVPRERAPRGAPWGMGQHPPAPALVAPLPSQPLPHGAIHSWTAYKTARVFWKFIPVGGQKFSKREKRKGEEKQTQSSKYFRLQKPISWPARGSARAGVDEGHRRAGAGMREAPIPPLPAHAVPAGELEPGQALPCALAPGKGEKPSTEAKQRLVIQTQTRAQGSSGRNICNIPPMPHAVHAFAPASNLAFSPYFSLVF